MIVLLADSGLEIHGRLHRAWRARAGDHCRQVRPLVSICRPTRFQQPSGQIGATRRTLCNPEDENDEENAFFLQRVEPIRSKTLEERAQRKRLPVKWRNGLMALPNLKE